MKKEKCEKCKSENIVLVEYSYDSPEYYDGTSEIECKSCGTRFGRWTKKELKDGEIEKKYGRG